MLTIIATLTLAGALCIGALELLKRGADVLFAPSAPRNAPRTNYVDTSYAAIMLREQARR